MYEWFSRDVEIKTIEDIEKIMGYCALHFYAELYQVDKDDDPLVVERVRNYIAKIYPETARDIIMLLFKFIGKDYARRQTSKMESS